MKNWRKVAHIKNYLSIRLKSTAQVVLLVFQLKSELTVELFKIIKALQTQLVTAQLLTNLNRHIQQNLAQLFATIVRVNNDILNPSTGSCIPKELALKYVSDASYIKKRTENIKAHFIPLNINEQTKRKEAYQL